MKKYFYAVFSLILSFSLCWFSAAYQEILIEERGGKAMRVIKTILDGEHFVVTVPADTGGETLESLTKKVGGTSAINAAFFCPKDYKECGGQTFANFERIFKGDGANYSRFRPDTSVRGIFGFLQDGSPLFVQNKISTHDVGLISNINAERIEELYRGISNFPVLLLEWEDVTSASSAHIDSKMTGKGTRNFICSTEDGRTIYMGVIGSSSVWDLAPYLKKHFDCYNALFLDAGASTAMVYDENVLARGTRTLITDAFVVVDRETYLGLWGTIPQGVTPHIPEYTLTTEDNKMLQRFIKVIDAIYQQYDKSTYKTELISLFRKQINSGKLTESRKAIYNQVLIYLFTIDSL